MYQLAVLYRDMLAEWSAGRFGGGSVVVFIQCMVFRSIFERSRQTYFLLYHYWNEAPALKLSGKLKLSGPTSNQPGP
jgi:hypothetical protein